MPLKLIPKQKKKSIIGQVNASSYLLMLLLTLPVLLSMLIMVFYASRYHASLSRMEIIANLKPMIDYEISEELWSTISGRKTFDECGVYDTISVINTTLDEQIAQGGSSKLELSVARRTMDTLLTYVEQIETNMENGAPIAASEATLEEVRNVTILADSMLEDFITGEISRATQATSLLRRVVMFTAAAEVLMIVIAVVFTQWMLRRTRRFIREPIEHLEHFTALLAEGNLRAHIPPTDVVELEPLTERVEEMAGRLDALIEQNRREQENLKKSELRLLQAQINPHFLYNTLEAIVWQSETGRSDEVIQIARALSDFFRISLSSGADWIPVSQEIKHLTGYLSIQKMRYRDILNYQIDVDEEISSVYMLKLLLQPLVENALYHGIKNRRGGGMITVTGRREGDYLCFCVADTGRGMTPEELARVIARLGETTKRSFARTDSSSGFGLSNVNQRICLYYNQPAGLQIESGPEGTSVSFRVPCKNREDEHHD